MPKLQQVPEAHVEYAYGIYLLTPKHRLMRTLRRRYQPVIHGHRAWGSSYLLMDYLTHRGMRRGARAAEIGCGWGGLSIFCARKFNAKMTGIDLDPAVFPFMDVLADLNGVEVAQNPINLNALKGRDLGEFKYIFGSDVCFWDSLIDPLARMTGRALNNGVERVIIADPGRPTFYEYCDLMATRHNATLQEWYAIEPDRFEGEIVEIKKKSRKKRATPRIPKDQKEDK